VPEGKLTIGVHVSLSPKWLNPQETPGAMANELLWKMHDYMIKAAQGNLYHPNNSAPFWLMFPDMDDSNSPFHDVWVRKAVSLTLDRQYLADQETAGMGTPWGNFIPPEWPGAVQRPPDEFALRGAKRLMAEVGYANGLSINWFTPFPAVESLSLRVMEQPRAIGIKSQINVMERPVYTQELLEGKPQAGYGHKGFPGRQIVMSISVIPGDASLYVCNGKRVSP
jgi:ABC-type transport system substrate-binding protein